MRTLTLSILVFISIVAKTQSIQFYREDISFTINDGYFYVDGVYNFCNNSDSEIQKILFYPFPQDDSYGEVDSIFAVDVKNNVSVLSKYGETGAYFIISIEPYGVVSYRIGYRQKIETNKAEYILMTTKIWGLPFDNAHYSLTIPAKYDITSFSYEPDSVSTNEANKVYYWTKLNFMPDKNFIIEFKLAN